MTYNENHLKAFMFWFLSMFCLIGATLFATIEVMAVVLQSPQDYERLAELNVTVNPHPDVNNHRMLYMIACCIPFAIMLLFRNKIARWINVGLVVLLTLVNASSGIEHWLLGDTVLSIVILLLVGSFGLLSIYHAFFWAKQDVALTSEIGS